MKKRTNPLAPIVILALVLIILFLLARSGTLGPALKNLVASSGSSQQAQTRAGNNSSAFTPSTESSVMPQPGNTQIKTLAVNVKDLKQLSATEIETIKQQVEKSGAVDFDTKDKESSAPQQGNLPAASAPSSSDIGAAAVSANPNGNNGNGNGAGSSAQSRGSGGAPSIQTALGTGFNGDNYAGAFLAGGGACDCQIARGGKSVASDVVVTLVNNYLSVWNKTTGANMSSVYLGSILGLITASDARLLYDQDSDQFIVFSELSNGNNAIGITKNHNPAGVWNVYDLAQPYGLRGYLYLGVNHDMITLTTEDNTLYYPVLLAMDKQVAIAGPATITQNQDWAYWFLPSGAASFGQLGNDQYAPWAPALTFDKTPNSAEYMVRWGFLNNTSPQNTIELAQLKCTTASCASPNFGASNDLQWNSFGTLGGLNSGYNTWVPLAPQGTGNSSTHTAWTHESTMSDVVFRNGNLWFTSAVGCSGTTCPPAVSATNRSSVYFAGIDMTQVPSGGNPALHKESLIDDPSGSANPMNYYFPSIAVSSCNAIGLGFNGSSSALTPGVYVASGWDSDPTPLVPVLAKQSTYNNGFLGNISPGDFSGTEVDPTNDSFWSAVSYPSNPHGGSVNWQDFIQNFSAPLLTAPTIFNTNLFNWDTDNGNTPTPCGLSFPSSVIKDSANNRLFVVDSWNARVLVYDTSATNGGAYIAKYVLGQTDFTSKMINSPSGSVNAAGFAYGPGGLAYDSNNQRLFVGDGARILAFNVNPAFIANGEPATNVLGQPLLTTADNPNQGSATATQNGLYNVRGLWYDTVHNYLWVGERGNSRVLLYDVRPSGSAVTLCGTTTSGISNGMNASCVLGQPNFTSNACNNGGISASSLCAPSGNGIAIDSATDPTHWKLWVGDSLNNRALRYDLNLATGAPSANGIAASYEIGQPDFSTGILDWTSCGSNGHGGGNPQNPSKCGLAYAYSLSFDPVRNLLFVNNEFNCTTEATCTHNSPAANSVMIFKTDAANLANGMNASYIIGEPTWTQANIRGKKNTQGTTADCLTNPTCDTALAAPFGSWLDFVGSDTYLYEASADDNRILKFRVNTSPDLSSANGLGNALHASDVWGQGPH